MRVRAFVHALCRAVAPHRGCVETAWVLSRLKTRCERLSTYARFLRMACTWSATVTSIPEDICLARHRSLGSRVEVFFEDVTEDVTLPQFRPAGPKP